MYYYKLYIGLANLTTPAIVHSVGDQKRHKQGTTNVDIFCSREKAETSPFITRSENITGNNRQRHSTKRQRAQWAKQQEISGWLREFDYRFGRVQIEWWNIYFSEEAEMQRRQQDTIGQFEPQLECSTEYETGVLRLFRNDTDFPDPTFVQSPSTSQTTPSAVSASDASTSSNHINDKCELERPRVLAVLAVPGYMTPTDFLSFTRPFGDSIEHVRVVRDNSPNHYMILLKFRCLPKADEFYTYYNGKTFSPLEPETCHVVYISEVQCEVWDVCSEDIDRENKLVRASPAELFMLPVSPTDYKLHNHETELPTCPVCLERLDSAVSGLLTTLCQHMFHCRCLARWGDGNCPVCRYSQTSAFVDTEKFQQAIANVDQLRLDDTGLALDQTSGVGNHVARASGTSAMEPGKAPDTGEQNSCHICERKNDLWICLICGTIGCGRYANGHAKDHFELTQHPYSMELESQSVWDYAGDGYVHRLMQNMADRKVIALDTLSSHRPPNESDTIAQHINGNVHESSITGEDQLQFGDGAKNARALWQRAPPSQGSFVDAREKLVAVTQEYELLLVSQLESQREHYEMQLARMHHQQAQQLKKCTELESKLSNALRKHNEVEQQQANYKSEHLADLEKKLAYTEEQRKEWLAERKRLEANANKFLKKSNDDARLLLEEKAIAKQFADNQIVLNKRIAELEENSVDLNEQIRDLSFFISTQKSLADVQNAESELHGASVVGVADSSTSRSKSKGKGKRRIPRK
ncbi:hypothetical protein H4R24_003132 [Coemansia sp. RSA 988]|nr:hypothetical protein H4R24_003132 [Coemansia sp. RSA 988]